MTSELGVFLMQLMKKFPSLHWQELESDHPGCNELHFPNHNLLLICKLLFQSDIPALYAFFEVRIIEAYDLCICVFTYNMQRHSKFGAGELGRAEQLAVMIKVQKYPSWSWIQTPILHTICLIWCVPRAVQPLTLALNLIKVLYHPHHNNNLHRIES
jgi:hypothetical protein